jgi:hemoglobin
MKRDITNRKDIELLVNTFYDKVKSDSLLKHFFKGVPWDAHLKTMYNFWENAIFYSGTYNGNPMSVHHHLHKKMPLSANDFKRWIELFIQTTNELFAGEKAMLIKQKATNIATVMQIKIIEKKLVSK